MTSERRLRLLSLDGGGVRGLASLFLLRQLLHPLGNPKPCEHFDMICGTSTGGLIAIMLGRLEMTIDASIEAFTSMMDDIFIQQHRFGFHLHNSRVRGRFDTKKLEDSIKKVIEDAGYSHGERLRRLDQTSKCKTVVVAMTAEGTNKVVFTDYEKPGESSAFYDDVKIWEAARATCAATTFFDPISITSGGLTRKYWDGGLLANNPINSLWAEAQSKFGPDPLEPQIRCLLSIGTGRPPSQEFGEGLKEVGKSIVKIATETQETANQFHELHVELVDRHGYFRFNPPDMMEVKLQGAEKKGLIHERTEAYGNDPAVMRVMSSCRDSMGTEPSMSMESFVEMRQFA